MATNEIVARKHWIAYLRILLGYGIWLLLLLAIASFMASQMSRRSHLSLVGMIVLIVFAVSALFAVASWLETRSFTWTAEEERLVLHSGWLPWQKTNFGISYDTIFEAYVTFGFFAKLFGYRSCVIQRTEGVTSQTIATHMANGEAISRAINGKVKEVRALRYGGPQMISEAPRVGPSKTPAEQLKDLAALKADGTITVEEFDLMKRKIIQG